MLCRCEDLRFTVFRIRMAYFMGKYKESLRNHLMLKSLEIVKNHEDQTNYVILMGNGVH